MSRVCFHQATMGKSNQKIEKHKKYSSARKVTRTTRTAPMPLPVVVKALVGVVRKKKKLVTVTLAYFDNLKEKQQDLGSKNWYYTESFVNDNLKSQNQVSEIDFE